MCGEIPIKGATRAAREIRVRLGVQRHITHVLDWECKYVKSVMMATNARANAVIMYDRR